MDVRERIRAKFPALKKDTVFLENAGGSQVPEFVIRKIDDYFRHRFVQPGADYEVSRQATATIDSARRFLEVFFNGRNRGKVVMGPSTSALSAMLADCYRRAEDPERNEIVICQAGHEANVGPWDRLGNEGYVIKTWELDPDSMGCPLDRLEPLITSRTRIVAVVHTSNILGEVLDMAEICRLAHQRGARVVVDGVAYAPHRAIDVDLIDADFYLFSLYKVFGPHMAALYGRDDALRELEGPNHYFIDREDIPYKFELGGVLHEGCAGVLGLWDYLCFLTDTDPDLKFNRQVIEDAYRLIAELEAPLTDKLLGFLSRHPRVKVIGSSEPSPARVPTISFVHQKKTSREISLAGNSRGLGYRYGHFYAHRLCAPLGLDPEDAVVRVSMVHYNTPAEVDQLLEFFKQIL